MFDYSKGKYFWNNGGRYEGYWKDEKPHGQGKKEVISFDLLILTLFDDSTGKVFVNNGNRYEGQF